MIQLIASLSAKPTVWENTSFIIVGFLFVILVLATLSLVTSLIGSVFRRLDTGGAKPLPAVAPPVGVPSPPPLVDDEIPEHIIAIISAATHVILKGRPQRITGIRTSGQGWAQEGRREIFSSHRFR